MPVFLHCKQIESSPHHAISIGRDKDFVSKSSTYPKISVTLAIAAIHSYIIESISIQVTAINISKSQRGHIIRILLLIRWDIILTLVLNAEDITVSTPSFR
jgi:hypothetical protein